MKPLIDPIGTSDGQFHGRNTQTGELATVVTPKYMNDSQAGTRSLQQEVLTILAAGGVKADEATNDQLLTALKKVLIAADDERVKNALQKNNNLSDVADAAKALANIGGAPATRKINGHPLTTDANVTAQDIFNDQAVAIGDAVDLNTLTTPGLYFQTANVQAKTGHNYPEPAAGSLEVYKHAGITQVYRIYANSGTYIRTFNNGTWSVWTLQYDAAHKPAPADIGAVPASGGSVAHLDNATYYKTNPAEWYGGGAFADQYKNNAAPFLIPYGHATPKDISQYLPIIKGVSHTESYGYSSAVSFGILRSGKNDFGSAVICIMGDNGDHALYSFDASGAFNAPGQLYGGGSITAAGQVSSGGNIVAGQGLYESGGKVRVYSSNNPPPGQNLAPYATTSWVSGNFYNGAQSDARYNLKNVASLAAAGGWQHDGSTGLIMQMGIVNRTDYTTPVTFPRAFPNYCCGVLLTLNSYIDDLGDSASNIRALSHSNTGFTYGAHGSPENTAFWVAFGQ